MRKYELEKHHCALRCGTYCEPQSEYAMDISLSFLNRYHNAQYEISFNSQSLFAMELLLKKRHPWGRFYIVLILLCSTNLQICTSTTMLQCWKSWKSQKDISLSVWLTKLCSYVVGFASLLDWLFSSIKFRNILQLLLFYYKSTCYNLNYSSIRSTNIS